MTGELIRRFVTIRLLGTPNETIWPGVSQHRDWHEFPQWRPQDLSLAVPGLSAVGLDLLAVSLPRDTFEVHEFGSESSESSQRYL